MAQRAVAGVIKRDGSIISGTGFSVIHQTPGTYMISFNPAFNHIPAVSLQHIWGLGDPNNPGGSMYDIAAVAGLDNQRLHVHTGYLNLPAGGQVEDREFSFIAIGE